ncbi:MAG: sugar phosphate isomerase/epimerase, partial [Bacteroidetes bacterium]|nr:sugar phosphate isomerase/epimerase [Bacteroidota bacterium]
MQRRNFIQTTATATTALMLSSFDTFALTNQPAFKMNSNFELKILATNWGFPGTIDEYCNKAKHDGYDGIEIWWQPEPKAQDELFAALNRYQLAVGFLCAGHESNFKDNLASFKKMVSAAAANAVQKPLYINCHSGKDYFSFDDNKNFIDYTIGLSKETGIKICHETHRSRILYSAPVARNF